MRKRSAQEVEGRPMETSLTFNQSQPQAAGLDDQSLADSVIASDTAGKHTAVDLSLN